MARLSVMVGGCTFNRWRYATWPLISVGVDGRGFRVGAVLPVLLFGFVDADRSLIEFSRSDRSVLIPWKSVREISSRRPTELSMTMVDGWRLRFGTVSEPVHGLVEEARAHMSGRSHT